VLLSASTFGAEIAAKEIAFLSLRDALGLPCTGRGFTEVRQLSAVSE
jgi:hypothetical protein